MEKIQIRSQNPKEKVKSLFISRDVLAVMTLSRSLRMIDGVNKYQPCWMKRPPTQEHCRPVHFKHEHILHRNLLMKVFPPTKLSRKESWFVDTLETPDSLTSVWTGKVICLCCSQVWPCRRVREGCSRDVARTLSQRVHSCNNCLNSGWIWDLPNPCERRTDSRNRT